MKNVAILLVLFVLLGSCNKILDYIEHHHPPKPLPCTIDAWNYFFREGVISTNIFYDSAFNPVRVEMLDENGITTNERFTYDASNRLLTHEMDRGGVSYYQYSGNHRTPIVDSFVDIFDNVYVTRFRLDYKDRIIGELGKPETSCYYTSDGNRQPDPADQPGRGHAEYTDKPSIYSLHPTWQILYRNFSKNSTTWVSEYNDKGLPLKFNNIPDTSVNKQPFYDLGFSGFTILYSCRN